MGFSFAPIIHRKFPLRDWPGWIPLRLWGSRFVFRKSLPFEDPAACQRDTDRIEDFSAVFCSQYAVC